MSDVKVRVARALCDSVRVVDMGPDIPLTVPARHVPKRFRVSICGMYLRTGWPTLDGAVRCAAELRDALQLDLDLQLADLDLADPPSITTTGFRPSCECDRDRWKDGTYGCSPGPEFDGTPPAPGEVPR